MRVILTLILATLGGVMAWGAFGRMSDENRPGVPLSDVPLPTAESSQATRVGGDNLPMSDIIEPFSHDSRAHFHPHGAEVCRSGCALSNHPTELLEVAEFHQRLRQYAAGPMSEDCQALETLLYYGKQTSDLLNRLGTGPLGTHRATFLKSQLSRTHVWVEFRVIDEQGVMRVSLPPTRVPLDRRHEFTMEVKNLQPLVTSGTVKRVGLNHIWVRL